MPGEAALDGQGVVVEAQDDIALGVEQEGSGGGAWLKGKLLAARGDAWGWGLVMLDV